MADGVKKLGGGWDAVPAGCAEDVLRKVLAAGDLTGDPVCQAVTAAGYAARGCAYYPKDGDKGPFYALANPHDYAALDVVDGAPQWDLIGFDPSQVKGHDDPTPADDDATVLAAIGALRADVAALRAKGDANTAAIQTQIDQVVKNAEKSVRAMEPIVAALLPALSGLFVKK